ncbi:hypothetical protein D3C77_528680 [compost metagenome]
MVSNNMISQHSIRKTHAGREYTARVFHHATDAEHYAFTLEIVGFPIQDKRSEKWNSEDEAISAAENLAHSMIDGKN